MSHYGQRWTVPLSSTSGNQSAVRTGGSQVSQSAVEWRSAVGSRQSVSSQRRGQRRRRRRRTTTAELPAHCRTGSAGTMRLRHNIIWAAEPPALCRTCGTAASDGGNDGSRHGGGGGSNRHRERAAAEFPAWLPGADRHSATGSGRSSCLSFPPPPLSHAPIKMTKAAANDDGGDADGGSLLMPQTYCLMGLGGPHRGHGVPTPMHAPACYTGGRATSTATAKA